MRSGFLDKNSLCCALKEVLFSLLSLFHRDCGGCANAAALDLLSGNMILRFLETHCRRKEIDEPLSR
jgi:hypothetical protein